MLQLSYPERIVYGILLTPLFEEIFFRLIYVFNRRNLYLIIFTSLCLLSLFIIKYELNKAYLFFGVSFFFCLLLLFFQGSSTFFNNHFKFLFYVLAAIFAVLHILNFSGIGSAKHFLVMFLVIPQFILG